MSRLRTRPSAFTLIELLVVIAIIGILIALLLPAVQKIREAAARMHCSNNMKQIALAAHGYHDAQGHLPVNAGPGYNYNASSPNCWSWLAKILPYIEQEPLYNQLGVAQGATMNQAVPSVAMPVKTFLCPSDLAYGGAPRNDEANIGTTFANGPPVTVGQTNYKGVCGNNWAWSSKGYNNADASGNTNGLDAGNGMFFRSDFTRPLRLTDVKDGLSNTFMVGEDIPSYNVHCDWAFFNHATGTCAIPPNYNVEGTAGKADWPNVYSFRSNHSQGLNFAFGDGGVQFISNSIDLTVYRGLASISGGEVVSRP